MLSQTSEYALRAVVCLAQHAGRPLTTQQLAALTRVPTGYLSKVLQALGRAGLITSQRGIGGGSTLAVPAEELSILRVIQTIEPVERITTCPLGLKSHGRSLCPLHRKLDDTLALIERSFGRTTIDELLKTPSHSTPLCEVTVGRAG